MPGATVDRQERRHQPDAAKRSPAATARSSSPTCWPARYDLTVTVDGFKTYEQKGIVLVVDRARRRCARSRSRSAACTETVTVAGRVGRRSRRTSGERSATHHRDSRSRTSASRAATSWARSRLLPGRHRHVRPRRTGLGQRSAACRSTVRRRSTSPTTASPTRTPARTRGNYAAPALDSIAEVKVQTSNFQAEYGRSSGATITVVTKSGTQDFRGTAAYYKRDEAFNAQRGIAAAAATPGQTARRVDARRLPVRQHGLDDRRSGPRPGHRLQPATATSCSSSGRRTSCRAPIPATCSCSTDADRARAGGRLLADVRQRRAGWICIRDPLVAGLACNVNTGGAGCFPDNIIPANRINPIGLQMLNLFPLPNATDPTGTGQYNYTYQTVLDKPRNDQVAARRLQHRARTRRSTRACSSATRNARGAAFWALAPATAATPAGRSCDNSYEINTVSMVNTLLHTFSSDDGVASSRSA